MADHVDHLKRWLDAGIVDQATADHIAAFEAQRAADSPGDAERPGVIEAVIYLGLAVVAVGAVVLGGQNWDAMSAAARVAALAVPGALSLGLGLWLRLATRPELGRAGHVALAVSVALLGGAAVVLGREVQGIDDFNRENRVTLVLAASASVILAALLWRISPSHPQVFALGGSLVFLAGALGSWPDDDGLQVFGGTLLVAGAAGVTLTDAGLMAPRESARAVFALLLAWGPYFAGLDGTVAWAEAATFAVAATLIGLSVVRGSFIYMALGTAIAFIGLVTFIFEHFEDDLGAPFALILSGVILIAAVLGLAQARNLVRRRRVAT